MMTNAERLIKNFKEKAIIEGLINDFDSEIKHINLLSDLEIIVEKLHDINYRDKYKELVDTNMDFYVNDEKSTTFLGFELNSNYSRVYYYFLDFNNFEAFIRSSRINVRDIEEYLSYEIQQTRLKKLIRLGYDS